MQAKPADTLQLAHAGFALVCGGYPAKELCPGVPCQYPRCSLWNRSQIETPNLVLLQKKIPSVFCSSSSCKADTQSVLLIISPRSLFSCLSYSIKLFYIFTAFFLLSLHIISEWNNSICLIDSGIWLSHSRRDIWKRTVMDLKCVAVSFKVIFCNVEVEH